MRRDGRAALLVGVHGRRPRRDALAPHPAAVRGRIARCRRGEARCCRRSKGIRMAKAAVETAVLDAELRAAGRSFGERLGAARECGRLRRVGRHLRRRSRSCSTQVDGLPRRGLPRIKLKIEPGWDSSPCAPSASAGPRSPLQVDANTAYTLADEHVASPRPRRVRPAAHRAAPARRRPARPRRARRAASRTPICLDESILSARVGRRCDRPRRVLDRQHQAGPRRRLPRSRARARRVPAARCRRCGAAACSRPASAAPPTWPSPRCPDSPCPGDTSASDRYFAPDITEPFVLEDGQLACRRGRASACGRSRMCWPPPRDRSRWCVRRAAAAGSCRRR